jgi:hypothetical protein
MRQHGNAACRLRPFRLHALDLAPHVRQEPGFAWANGSDQGASHRVGEIIMGPRVVTSSSQTENHGRRFNSVPGHLKISPLRIDALSRLSIR